MRQQREAGHRVPIPSELDISRVYPNPHHGLVALAGTKVGQPIYLNLGFRTGRIETIFLDENGAGRLIAVLKALSSAKAEIAASAVTLEGDGSIGAQEGYMRSVEDV